MMKEKALKRGISQKRWKKKSFWVFRARFLCRNSNWTVDQVRPDTPRRQGRRLPPCPWSSPRCPFPKEKMPWCFCPFKNEAYKPAQWFSISPVNSLTTNSCVFVSLLFQLFNVMGFIFLMLVQIKTVQMFLPSCFNSGFVKKIRSSELFEQQALLRSCGFSP